MSTTYGQYIVVPEINNQTITKQSNQQPEEKENITISEVKSTVQRLVKLLRTLE